MPAVYDLSVIVTWPDAPSLRETFTGDREQAITWLRDIADELEGNDIAVITRPEPDPRR